MDDKKIVVKDIDGNRYAFTIQEIEELLKEVE